jgi:hypothetical protein
LDTRAILVMSPGQLVKAVHAAGINLRYLGFIRDLVQSPHIANLVLLEMMTRVVKNFVKRRLRFHSQAQDSSVSTEAVLAASMSLVLGRSKLSQLYWCEGTWSVVQSK